jgi:hypothetical protein
MPSGSEHSILQGDGGSAARARRYTMLRAAQRALYPMRPMPGSLPAERALRDIRQRLRAIGPDPQSPEEDPVYASPEARLMALHEVDESLADVSRELRGIAERISFSEIRATLPQLCETRPDEVAALLDLCLEDPQVFAPLRHLIDYLVTLLSTVTSDGNRVVWSDPVGATPRLREVCESFTDYDGAEVRAHCEAFDRAILELPRQESLEPVMHGMRDYKAQVGRLMLVPEVLQRIVEYNVAVSNRLEEVLEAERTLVEAEAHTPLLVQAPTQPAEPTEAEAQPAAPPSTWRLEGSDVEVREGRTLSEIAEELRKVVAGHAPNKGTSGKVSKALDTSPLSAWENEAFSESEDNRDAELLRIVIVVGLLLRQADEAQALLEGTGLDLERLKTTWVPHLDRKVQEAIASSLGGDSYQSAKQLAQSKAKFLYPNLKRRARTDARGPSTRPLDDARRAGHRPEGATSRAADRRGPRRAVPGAAVGGKVAPSRWVAAVAGLGVLLLVGALQLRSTSDEDGVLNIPTRAMKAVSPYLESAYRDNNGYGTKFFGTVTDDWDNKGELFQREEAIRIGQMLATTGVEQVMLFDKRRRLRAHYVRGTLVYPRTPDAPSVEFH